MCSLLVVYDKALPLLGFALLQQIVFQSAVSYIWSARRNHIPSFTPAGTTPSLGIAKSHYLTFNFFPEVLHASRKLHNKLLSCADWNPRLTLVPYLVGFFFKERRLSCVNGASLWFILLAYAVMSLWPTFLVGGVLLPYIWIMNDTNISVGRLLLDIVLGLFFFFLTLGKCGDTNLQLNPNFLSILSWVNKPSSDTDFLWMPQKVKQSLCARVFSLFVFWRRWPPRNACENRHRAVDPSSRPFSPWQHCCIDVPREAHVGSRGWY